MKFMLCYTEEPTNKLAINSQASNQSNQPNKTNKLATKQPTERQELVNTVLEFAALLDARSNKEVSKANELTTKQPMEPTPQKYTRPKTNRTDPARTSGVSKYSFSNFLFC